MTISPEHLERLQNLGYNPREAQFLSLVATHSGHFTARQFLAFTGQRKGCMLDRFIARLLDSHHARTIDYSRNTRVFNVFSRQIYGALDKDNLRNRRHLSDELIHTRLLILDFVLAQPNLLYLETEQDKLAYFHEQLRIPLSVIPGHVYAGIKSLSTTKRFFVDRFSVFLTPVSTTYGSQTMPIFTYCDSHDRNLKPFREHLRSYQQFLRRLSRFEFIYAAPDPAKFERARRVFKRMFVGSVADSPDDLIRYFRVRKLWDEQKYNSLTREDRDRLRAGNIRYSAERFQNAYKTWLANATSDGDSDIVVGSVLTTPESTFHTQLLPTRYDIFVRQGGPDYRTAARNRSSIEGSTSGTSSTPAGTL
jgi:hypothetical protein